MWETWVRSLDWEDPLEKGMTTPPQYSCLENSMVRGDWRGCKESEITELLTLFFLEEAGSLAQ